MITKVNNFNYYNKAFNFKALRASQPSITSTAVTSPIPPSIPENAKCNTPKFNSVDLLANYNKALINFKGGESTGSIGYFSKLQNDGESTGSIGYLNKLQIDGESTGSIGYLK